MYNTSNGTYCVFVFPLGILTSVKPWSSVDIFFPGIVPLFFFISIVKYVVRFINITFNIPLLVLLSMAFYPSREINFVDETVRTLAGNGTKGSDYRGGGQGSDQACLDFLSCYHSGINHIKDESLIVMQLI